MKPKPPVQNPNRINIYILPSQRIKLDIMARKAGLNRSAFIAHLIDKRTP